MKTVTKLVRIEGPYSAHDIAVLQDKLVSDGWKFIRVLWPQDAECYVVFEKPK